MTNIITDKGTDHTKTTVDLLSLKNDELGLWDFANIINGVLKVV